MKTFILAIVAFALSSSMAFANSVEPIKTLIEDKIITIDLANYHSDFIEIDISDRAGYVLYTEKINTADYKQRKFSLEELPLGNYAITIKTAQLIISKKIDIAKSQMSVSEDIISYKPHLSVKENRWNVNLLALNQETNITIYNKDQTLYNETITNQMGIYKSYDLNNLERGKYFILIEVGDESYMDTFEKS